MPRVREGNIRVGINARFLSSPRLEGFGRYTLEVTRRLVRDHPEAEFVLFFDRPIDPEYRFAENVTPVVLRPPAGHPLLTLIWFEFNLAPALLRHRIDVLLSPDGALPLRRGGPPSVPVIHDLGFEHFSEHLGFADRWYWRLVVRAAARRAARIVTISEFTKGDLVATYGVPAARIDVAPNGVEEGLGPLSADERRLVRDELTGGEPYFLHVGAIQPRKNVATLLRAFDRFKERSGCGTKLLLSGRMAWKYRDVERAHAAMRHGADVRFLGYMPRPALARILASALGLVCVSHYEGFALPVAEAMACGVPVIGADRAAIPEVAGDAAVLVDPGDVGAIAAAMVELAGDSTRWDDLAARGLARAHRFDWNLTAAGVWRALMAAAPGGSERP